MHDSADEDTLEILLPIAPPGPDLPRPFSSLVRVDIGARSDAGKVRPNNEDAYIVFRLGRSWERLATSLTESLPQRHDETGYALVVADGVGGMAGGEVASSMAIRAGVHFALSATKWSLKFDSPETREVEVQETIEQAHDYMRSIHRILSEQARADPKLAGMGTTFTAAYSVGADVFTLHVGDSRAYLHRGTSLRQLTHDDTLAQLLADSGGISQEDVSRHRWRHVLSGALGSGGDDVKVHVQHLELRDGDWLFLCTDGLTDMVDDAHIAEILNGAESAQSACDALVSLALERGGRDNVTVLAARYGIPPR